MRTIKEDQTGAPPPAAILAAQIEAHRAGLVTARGSLALVALATYGLLFWAALPQFAPFWGAGISVAGLLLLTAAARLASDKGIDVAIGRIVAEYSLAIIPLFTVTYLVLPDLPTSLQMSLLAMLSALPFIATASARFLPNGPKLAAVCVGLALLTACYAIQQTSAWWLGNAAILIAWLLADIMEDTSRSLARRVRAEWQGGIARNLLNEYEEQGSDRLFSLNKDGHLLNVTAPFAQLARMRVGDLEGRHFLSLFVPDEAQRQLADKLATHQPVQRLVVTLGTRGEQRRWSLTARPVEEPGGPAFRGVISDVTSEMRAEERVSRLAHYDALTDLSNRQTFEDQAIQYLAEAAGSRKTGLLLINIDHFKSLNEEHGSRAGDAILKETGRRLQMIAGRNAIVARLGGDEFALLVSSVQVSAKLETLAGKILEEMSLPIRGAGALVHMSVSIGIATAPDDAKTFPTLLQNAETALRAAREAGRKNWQKFDKEMNASATARRTLIAEMEQGLERGEFYLNYQPLVDSRTLEVKGFETLLRWTHSTRGFVSPAEFIPLAEESGFINELGAWVIRSATAEAARWPGNLSVAINVSPLQMRGDGLEHIVAEALRTSGLQPSRLEIEITEGVLLQESRRTRALLERLRALGIRFSLDDFGTGFSSLGYLQKFAFHKIKIDRSFVIDMQNNKNCHAIIKAVIGLARDMGMVTVAEGIELPGQLAALQQMGCNQIQGYLTGKPMSAEAARELVRLPDTDRMPTAKSA
ncbi:putative bifunctional diguanylate cyclase/phosphodiesterase [Pacificimonas sp. ICDLI1SI03]